MRRSRFGILTFPRGPFEQVAREWRICEELGFDHAWLTDTLASSLQDVEAWTLLAALARETSRMRIGTLITIIPLRHPTMVAAQAITLDRISDGRIELGIGAGDTPADSAAVGADQWSATERAARLEEYAAMLDRLLRAEPMDHRGRYYRAEQVRLGPPIQRPRPPLIVAAQGPRGIRTAARWADGWNTLGGQPMGRSNPIPLGEAVARTREQVRSLEEQCHAIGRDPRTMRRSVLAFRAAVDPLSSLEAFDEFVGAYREAGLDEFVFYWPPIESLRREEPIPAARRSTLERIAVERLR